MIKWFKKKKKEREELKLTENQRILAVLEISETEGYKVLMEDWQELANEIRDVSVLAANYGNKRIDSQLGVLGGAGIIASHIIQTQIDKYEEK